MDNPASSHSPRASETSTCGRRRRPIACLNCRQKKLKCDGVRPIWSRLPKNDACESSDSLNQSRTKLLGERLARLKLPMSTLWSKEITTSEFAGNHDQAAKKATVNTSDESLILSPPPATPHDHSNYPRACSNTPSDGRGSSWLSVFSDAGSDESSIGSPFRTSPSPQRKLYVHDLHSHQDQFKDLDLTGRVTILDRYPFESGTIADIYRGILNIFPTSIGSPRLSYNNRTPFREVAVKIFRRMHSEPEALERASRSLYEEAQIWRCLEHPNILPFLGISLDLGHSPALLSPLCVSGPIMKYLQHKTKSREEKLQMVLGVANGLAHLHSEGIVHGNLCTKKILVDGVGSPVICGYGMSKTLGQQANPTSLLHSPIRFTAPESFAVNGNGSSLRTTSADVYAFSMVTLEIVSGLVPYHHLPSEHDVFMRVLRGERPVRTHLDTQMVTDRLWRLLTSMWDQNPSSRPEIPGVTESLTEILSWTSETEMWDNTQLFEDEFVRSLKEEERSSSGEETLFGDPALVHVHRLDLKGRVTQDDQYPFAGGGNSNIYRGKLTRADGRKIRVAIKMIRISNDGSGQLEEMLRRLKREVDVWSRLRHKNLLPFIGVCEDLAPSPLLISPFYKFGHIGTYIRKHPDPDRQELAKGVASGLQFLHENQIIHGDLKVQNVLVDKKGNPCICDFGISKIVDRRGFTTSSVGTPQYMAPELFLVVDRQDEKLGIPPPPRTTKNSDIYSFGLLVLEILTSEPPKGRPSQPVVMVQIVDNLRPKRWEYDYQMVSAEMWSILDQCWSSEPYLRPTIADILRSPAFTGDGPPPGDDPRPFGGSEHLPTIFSSSRRSQGCSTLWSRDFASVGQSVASSESQDRTDPNFRPIVTSPATRHASAIRRRDPTKAGRYVCPICGNDFTAQHNLRYHIQAHNSVREFECDGCGQRFGTPHVLKRHITKCRGRAKVEEGAAL
ncbi:kinase-like domain-containing protein [Mycena galopus ATCC 62051]|nr:kinase-like domain-containing protein [Mycena galopus ATCC 62051]